MASDRRFGDRMAKLAERLVEGTLVYVQGELTTRDRERTIKVPNGSAFIEAVVNQATRSRSQGRSYPHSRSAVQQ